MLACGFIYGSNMSKLFLKCSLSSLFSLFQHFSFLIPIQLKLFFKIISLWVLETCICMLPLLPGRVSYKYTVYHRHKWQKTLELPLLICADLLKYKISIFYVGKYGNMIFEVFCSIFLWWRFFFYFIQCLILVFCLPFSNAQFAHLSWNHATQELPRDLLYHKRLTDNVRHFLS